MLFQRSFQNFQDGQNPSRAEFLSALANLDSVLIRSSFHTLMAYSALRDLSLDTAVPAGRGARGGEIAIEVEDCECPAGYTGLSCEVRKIEE